MTDLYSLATGAWRLHVATVVAQFLGAAGVYFLSSFADPLKAVWVGAAAASLPGALVGIAWQRKSVVEYKDAWILWLYILCAAAMTLIAAPLVIVFWSSF